MRKNKFNGVFWVGIVPVAIVTFLVIMISFGVLYAVFKKTPNRAVTETSSVKQDTAKPEKIYIHDTVYMKVPQVCRKQHVSDNKQADQEPTKDANDTNNADNSIN